MKTLGLILLSFGMINALITAIGLCRTKNPVQRIHVTSMIALAALMPSLVGAAFYIGSLNAMIRVLIAGAFLTIGAPYLSQALLLRAVVDGDLEMPPTRCVPPTDSSETPDTLQELSSSQSASLSTTTLIPKTPS